MKYRKMHGRKERKLIKMQFETDGQTEMEYISPLNGS